MTSGRYFLGWRMVAVSVIILALLGPNVLSLANLYLNYVAKDIDVTISSFTLANSILHGVGIFFAPLAADLLVSRFKSWHALGILLFAVSFMGYGLAQSIYSFYLLSFIAGIGFQLATLMPVSMIVTNWFSKKRGLAMSIAMTGYGIGSASLSPLVTFSLEVVGWRYTYLIFGASMLAIALPLSIFGLVFKPADMGLKAFGEESDFQDQEEEGTTSAYQINQDSFVKLPLNKTVKQPFFIYLILGSVLVGINNIGGISQFPPFLQTLHGPQKAAFVISTYAFVGIFGKIAMGSVCDRFGIRITNVYQTVLMVATYGFMLASAINPSQYSFPLLAGIFFGLGNSNGTVLLPLVPAAIYSPKDYGRAYGFVQSAKQVGMTTGSVITAAIIQATGGHQSAWLFLGSVSLLAGVFWWLALVESQKFV